MLGSRGRTGPRWRGSAGPDPLATARRDRPRRRCRQSRKMTASTMKRSTPRVVSLATGGEPAALRRMRTSGAPPGSDADASASPSGEDPDSPSRGSGRRSLLRKPPSRDDGRRFGRSMPPPRRLTRRPAPRSRLLRREVMARFPSRHELGAGVARSSRSGVPARCRVDPSGARRQRSPYPSVSSSSSSSSMGTSPHAAGVPSGRWAWT